MGPVRQGGRIATSSIAYATAAPLGLPRGATVDQLKAALAGKVLAEGRLLGTFTRD